MPDRQCDDTPLPRTELTKKLWVYIREHGFVSWYPA